MGEVDTSMLNVPELPASAKVVSPLPLVRIKAPVPLSPIEALLEPIFKPSNVEVENKADNEFRVKAPVEVFIVRLEVPLSVDVFGSKKDIRPAKAPEEVATPPLRPELRFCVEELYFNLAVFMVSDSSHV